jgi:hypothetical protein
MKRLLVVSLLLSACVQAPIPKASENGSFETITFTQAVNVRDHAINTYSFSAGSTFVSDQVGPDDRTIYCGTAAINGSLFPVCIGHENPDQITIAVGSRSKEVRRSVPPGSIRKGKVSP